MKRFHLIAGLLLVIIFLLTGQYMDRFHGHLYNMASTPLSRKEIFSIVAGVLLHLLSRLKEIDTKARSK